MNRRGRPGLADDERERRSAICREWAAEIKKNSRLSAKSLARELGYGVSEEKLATGDYDGRKWRALASGSCSPSPDKFKQMTETALKKGWLNPFGWLRYKFYWTPNEEPSREPFGEDQQIWHNGTLGRTLLMLLAHARKCDVDQVRFFSDARAELNRMQSFLSDLGDDEIEQRARRIAVATAQELLDGPEYPTTSLGTFPGQ